MNLIHTVMKNTALILAAFLFGIINITSAATFTSVKTGDFNDGATWGNTSPGVAGTDFPGVVGDNVFISTGDLVTVKASPGVIFGTLDTFKSSFTVDPSVTIEFSGAATLGSKDNTLTVNGTLKVNSLTVASTGNLVSVGSGGTLDVTTSITLNGSDPTLTIDNLGSVTADSFSGGNNAFVTVDGNLDVTNTLEMNGTLIGDGTVYAGDYTGTGTIFGSDPGTLTDGVTYEQGTGEAIPLPVELTYFNVHNANDNVIITWQTATEKNNHYFTIERSVDGLYFETIGTVSGAGNSQITLNYSFTDASPLSGTTYYRLQQTDYDGKFEIFNMVAVSFYNEGALKVFPIPATNNLTIDFGGLSAQSNIQIMTIQGQVVKSLSVWESVQTIDVSDLAAGNYLLTIANGNQPLVKRIVIQ